MRAAPSQAVIRLGPGTFETRGEAAGLEIPPLPGWRPKSGQRLVGAGMGVTTLKLVGAFPATTITTPSGPQGTTWTASRSGI
jgi:hypothetical protein